MDADQAIPSAEPLAPGHQRSLPAQRDRTRPNNLPLPLTSFVGRTEALGDLQRRVPTARPLTLTGPGGVGKTRLALEAASSVQDQFSDGVWWVELAPLCDADQVAQEAARVLGLPEHPSRPRQVSIVDHLRDRDLLLVLDNCEHLVQACAELVGHLLQSCPGLRVLATSREALSIGGETVWSVPPLSVPCLDATLTVEALVGSEAGQLFLERARAAQPGLEMTASTVGAMAQVCCRLDGIPLAIELAAARAQVLSVVQIADRLDDWFRLLAGGSRLDVPHHQTLQAALDWSYDLLTPAEQKLFERLAVLVAGFGLEAAEAIAGQEADGQPVDVLDLLSHLVLKSLVGVIHGGRVRYRMLETIRQYALARLRASGDLDRARQRHLAYFLDLAAEAELQLTGEGQLECLTRLEVEHDNLRAALACSLESGAGEDGLLLATALAAFWLRVGYLTEGSAWLERALAAGREPTPLRAQALYQAGRLALQRGDYGQALELAGQSLALGRRLADRRAMARAQTLLGWVAHWQGDRDTATSQLEEALVLAHGSGDERTIARTLLCLGDLLLRRGALERAADLLQESVDLYQRMGDGWSLAWAFGALGDVARLQGNHRQAVSLLRLSLSFYQELGSKPEIPFPLEGLALSAADQGQLARAVRLWAAASAVRDSIHSHLPPSYQADCAPTLEKVRSALGAAAYAAAWAEGRALSLGEALALAAADAPDEARPEGHPPPASPIAQAHGLTPREVEVLRLVAQGLTDAQVAELLVISPRTVGKHLQSIYSKLYLPSRSAATRWAIEHDLA